MVRSLAILHMDPIAFQRLFCVSLIETCGGGEMWHGVNSKTCEYEEGAFMGAAGAV